MSKTSKEYWKEREYYNLLKSKKQDEDFINIKIQSIYDTLLTNINREIRSQVLGFARRNEISFEEARKRISKTDIDEYKALAKEYVENKDFTDKANREMSLYNVTMRLNRLELLSQIIKLHVVDSFSQIEKGMEEYLVDQSIKEYQRQAGLAGMYVIPDDIKRKAEFIVNQDYKNAHFSDRIWRDQRELQRRIERNIDSVILQGKSTKEFSRKFRDLVHKDIKKAKSATDRLALTESGRVWIQTQIQAYKDGGYEYLKVLTEPTACKECSPHDGDVVKLSEAVEGDNIPLWHPRCRCTTVAAFGEVKDLDYWEHDGEKYYIDDHHVILDYSEHEREVADLLAIKMNTTVNMVPRVLSPQDVSTPDYLIDNQRWDLKDIYGDGKRTLYNALKGTRKQAENFVFDVSNTKLTEDNIEKQIDYIFASRHKDYVKEIITIKDNKILKTFKK